jgi:fructan beta-fructosidase
MKIIIFPFLFFVFISALSQEAEHEIRIKTKYLNIPVESSQERQKMTFTIMDNPVREFVIRLSNEDPDYWVFADVSDLIGETLTIQYPEEVKGLKEIYQSDQIIGADSLYQETLRPQFHFSTRRGWINDPNGLVYYKGEYHLFYQHNPYEIKWENMHWGHAVSKDLIHWIELPIALYPDELGTMFSGSAAIDFNNSSGFQRGEEKPLIAAYTAHGPQKQVQCIAYSNDSGRNFTKYEGNPIIDSKEKWNSQHTRDPKIFWHEDSKKWVMVLFEKTGHSIYNSDDLKNWNYQSHIGGFWECPELFELEVDGNQYNKKWILYGASGTYMIGAFDGQRFTPETEKLNYFAGSMYAAQTFNNIPESDGRRIQIGWGRITQQGMPFNHMMTFPTELTLRSTRNGIRLFSEPISEIKDLHKTSYLWNDLTVDEANSKLKALKGDLFHIKMTIELSERNFFEFLKDGNSIVNYDFNYNKLNGVFYGGDHIENEIIDLELLVDRTSVEIFADYGRFSIIEQLALPANNEGFQFNTRRAKIYIHQLEVHELKSIWQ